MLTDERTAVDANDLSSREGFANNAKCFAVKV